MRELFWMFWYGRWVGGLVGLLGKNQKNQKTFSVRDLLKFLRGLINKLPICTSCIQVEKLENLYMNSFLADVDGCSLSFTLKELLKS